MLTLKELPTRSRPRERLKQSGPNALSDSELLSIILGSGIRGRDVLKVSKEVLSVIDQNLGDLNIDTLTSIMGIGEAKAGLLISALEFARRRIRPSGVRISSPKDILPLVMHLADRRQEHFVCISLNGAHEVIATRVITIGLVNSTQVHPREVFSDPLIDRACAIVLAHNHPSGNTLPSREDYRVTKILKDAGELLGIKVLDHIIFSGRSSYSFQENGEL